MASINTQGKSGLSSRGAPQLLFGTPARVLTSLALIVGLLAVVLNAVTAQEASTPPADVPQATPSATMPRLELKLEEANESDLGGKVTLYEFGDSTIVEFEATGAGGDHPAVIVPGVCGKTTGDPVFDLEPVDNTGKSSTTIDVPLEDLLAEDHVVEIRMSEDDFDTVIACAFIEGEPGLEPVASPSASPAATPSASSEANGVGGTSTNIDGTGGASNAAAPTMSVNLVDWSDTGVTGTAVLAAEGNSTRITITISGPGVTGGHEVHIHNGTCASPGTATYTLSPIDANGTSSTMMNLTFDQLTGGGYFINVHLDEANWDDWLVCGNITGTTTSLTSPTPSPVGGSTVTDGSAGGNTTMITTSAQAASFPQTVGVGDGLQWPSDTRTAVIWAIAGSSVVLLGTGLLLRAGERSGKQPRFTRLGL